jgi:hypothetical protein
MSEQRPSKLVRDVMRDAGENDTGYASHGRKIAGGGDLVNFHRDCLSRNHNSHGKLRILFILLCFAFISPPLRSDPEQVDKKCPTIELHSSDKSMVTRFCFPKEYVERGTFNSIGQDGEFISLEMTFPDMTPLAPEERTDHFSVVRSPEQDAVVESGHYFKIELHQGRISGVGKLIEQNIKERWLREPDDPQYSNFDIYSSIIMKKEVIMGYPILTRYYLPKEDNWNRGVYFECATKSKSDNQHLICQSTRNFDHMLYGGYYFSKSRLKDWKIIDEAANRFVHSHIIGTGTETLIHGSGEKE